MQLHPAYAAGDAIYSNGKAYRSLDNRERALMFMWEHMQMDGLRSAWVDPWAFVDALEFLLNAQDQPELRDGSQEGP